MIFSFPFQRSPVDERDRQTDRDGETETDRQRKRETDTDKSLILHSVLFFLSYVDEVFKYKYLSVTRICRGVKFSKRLDLDFKSPWEWGEMEWCVFR